MTPRVPQAPALLDRHRLSVLGRTLQHVPPGEPVILLAHEPDIFALDLDSRIVLTLSGHTHGGQIRILGWSPWIPSRYGLRYAYGHVVERGVGEAGLAVGDRQPLPEPLGGRRGHLRDAARPAPRGAHRRTVSFTFISLARFPPMILAMSSSGRPFSSST